MLFQIPWGLWRNQEVGTGSSFIDHHQELMDVYVIFLTSAMNRYGHAMFWHAAWLSPPESTLSLFFGSRHGAEKWCQVWWPCQCRPLWCWFRTGMPHERTTPSLDPMPGLSPPENSRPLVTPGPRYTQPDNSSRGLLLRRLLTAGHCDLVKWQSLPLFFREILKEMGQMGGQPDF